MNRTILYIERGNRSTVIHYINNESEVVEVLPERYLNNLYLNELTTLKGRIEAIKTKYHVIKNTPIYIKENLVLFPTHNKKSINNIYVNSIYIKHIESSMDRSKVIFYDNQEILIDKDIHLLKNIYEKCLKVNNQINQYY